MLVQINVALRAYRCARIAAVRDNGIVVEFDSLIRIEMQRATRRIGLSVNGDRGLTANDMIGKVARYSRCARERYRVIAARICAADCDIRIERVIARYLARRRVAGNS